MGRASVRFLPWLAGATVSGLVACSFDVPEPLLGDGGATDGAGDSTLADGADGATSDGTVAEGSPSDGPGPDQLKPPFDTGSDVTVSDGATDGSLADAPQEASGCAYTLCNGVCINVGGTDKNNCGACGRSCVTPRFPGGVCMGGSCNIVGATNGPSYLSDVSLDPYADAATALYAPSIFLGQSYASVAEIPFDSGSPSGQGTQIMFANAYIASYQVPGQGTLVAIASRGTDAPIQYGYWNSTLSGTVPIAQGGALHLAFGPFGNVLYYSQGGTQTSDAGITQACLYAMFSNLSTMTFGCERAGGTSASPAVHFQLSPMADRAYLLTQDSMLERIDLTGTGARTTIPFSAGGLVPFPIASGIAVDPGEMYLYYFTLESGASFLRQIQLSNGVDTLLETLTGEVPAGMLADSNNVYFASTINGSLSVRSLGLGKSGMATSLGSVTLPAGDVTSGWVQTATEIFFVIDNQMSQGNVYRVVKP